MSARRYSAAAGERAHVQRHVEGVLQLAVAVEEIPAAQPGHELQVGARGNREELGQPLQQTEHYCDSNIRSRGKITQRNSL